MKPKFPFSQNKELLMSLLEKHTCDKIAEMYGCTRTLISLYTKKFGIVNTRRRYNYPNLEPNGDLSYVIGVLKGDGCVYSTIKDYNYAMCLTAIDKDFVEEFSRRLANTMNKNDPYAINFREKRGQWITIARSKELYNYYVNNEYIPCIEQYPAKFLKGFFDSEGSIHSSQTNGWAKQWAIECTNNDVELLDIVERLMLKIGIESTRVLSSKKGTPVPFEGQRMCYKTKDVFKLIIPSRHHHKFARLIGFTIKRKQDRLDELISTTKEMPELYTCPVCSIKFKPNKTKQRFCCEMHKKSFGHVKEMNTLTDEQCIALYNLVQKNHKHLINASGHINKVYVKRVLKNKKINE